MLQNDLLTTVGALIGSSGAILSCEQQDWGLAWWLGLVMTPRGWHFGLGGACLAWLGGRLFGLVFAPCAFSLTFFSVAWLPRRHHVQGHEPLPGQRHPGRLRHHRHRPRGQGGWACLLEEDGVGVDRWVACCQPTAGLGTQHAVAHFALARRLRAPTPRLMCRAPPRPSPRVRFEFAVLEAIAAPAACTLVVHTCHQWPGSCHAMTLAALNLPPHCPCCPPCS